MGTAHGGLDRAPCDGGANAIGGGILFIWWLTALAGGEASYARFVDLMTSDHSGKLNLIPAIVLIGLTWSLPAASLLGRAPPAARYGGRL
jgi:hypothetical protein